ncbi:hypothetical protein [Yersinia enterocolitica]|nr:Uncharacterised protein [Yersinia frederiksenii]
MIQKREATSGEKPRRTVRRTAEYKAQLSAASAILAAKMEEKRQQWDSK